MTPEMESKGLSVLSFIAVSAPEEPDLGGGGEGSGSDDPDAKDRGEWGDIWDR